MKKEISTILLFFNSPFFGSSVLKIPSPDLSSLSPHPRLSLSLLRIGIKSPQSHISWLDAQNNTTTNSTHDFPYFSHVTSFPSLFSLPFFSSSLTYWRTQRIHQLDQPVIFLSAIFGWFFDSSELMPASRTLAIGAAGGAGAAGAVTAIAHFRLFRVFFFYGRRGRKSIFSSSSFVRKGGWEGLFFLFFILRKRGESCLLLLLWWIFTGT